ncbi:S8 family serine peptidase [Patescibacteria group bacterium]
MGFFLFDLVAAASRPVVAAEGVVLKKRTPLKTSYLPGRLIVGLKEPAQVDFQREISLKVPFVAEKLLFRKEGYSVRGLSGVTKLNKDFKVKEVRKLGKQLPLDRTLAIRLPPEVDLSQALTSYRQEEGVSYVELDYLLSASWVPDDPYFTKTASRDYQWNLAQIRMVEAWDHLPRGGASGVTVAVVDSGVAFENITRGGQTYRKAPELSEVNFVAPYYQSILGTCDSGCNCAVLEEAVTHNHPNDDSGHGTHVAGTIVQMANNGQHAAGMAFNVSLMPVKVLNYCGNGASSDITAGILYAVDNGADVINLSLGGRNYSTLLRAAVQYAVQKGVVVVAASGNGASRDSSLGVAYPARYPEVIAVGASRFDKKRAKYSDYGIELDLLAPGGQLDTDDGFTLLDQNRDAVPDGIVQQTIRKGDFTRFTFITGPVANCSGLRCLDPYCYFDENCGVFQGTSMAAPHVSAAAALLLSKKADLFPEEVRTLLITSANKAIIPGYDLMEHGAGILDVAAALDLIPGTTVTGTPTPTIIPTATVSPTPTSSVSPTVTSTITPTASLTPTVTASPTISGTPSPVNSPTVTPTLTPSLGDVNHDGRVNAEDALVLFSHYWQTDWPETVSPDPDSDGRVTLVDFAYILLDWGS